MNKKIVSGSALILAASLALSACSDTSTTDQDAGKAPDNTGDKKSEEVTYSNWTTFGYDLGLNRHVPFEEITKDNVNDLGIVWSAKFKDLDENIPAGNQNYPIVIDGVAYVSTSHNYVFAFDALTGEVKWEWKPSQELLDTIERTGMPSVNRGVAVAEGKVFMLTNDVGVVSIDQETGETVDYIQVSDYFPDITIDNGYYETTAPVYYDGKIFIGSSGGDNGVRGFEMAFNASDLTPAWDEPFWTVPPKGEDWLAEGLFGGGGAVWMPPSVDEETGLMYISAGNPAPDFFGASRPGANPHTNSVIALEADTGKMVWAQQQLAHDLWDYDTADSPTIINTTVDGEERKLVIVGTKGAEWFAYDAETGEPVFENVAFGKIDHPEPTPEGVLAYPGVLGGQNYAPDTFDPELNLALIGSIEQPVIYKTAKNEEEAQQEGPAGAAAFGTSYAPAADVPAFGRITAIDTTTGEVKWQIDTPDMQRGGLTSTATGLSFYGELDGKVKALDTATGEELWAFQTTGDTISAAPSIFEVDGKSYIMITSAGRNPQIFVFALGGDKTQGEASGEKVDSNPHK
ncbi:pyrroloquinoline quinone-dependent dehydrogenase [Chungangia koreensis]|uniref:Pyrroloquinoline quinone-dependent dehydrogenase n=1 Tax=Chungangia koreensis TaxID=752657 RepID=A0ABV8X9P5_9LACT